MCRIYSGREATGGSVGESGLSQEDLVDLAAAVRRGGLVIRTPVRTAPRLKRLYDSYNVRWFGGKLAFLVAPLQATNHGYRVPLCLLLRFLRFRLVLRRKRAETQRQKKSKQKRHFLEFIESRAGFPCRRPPWRNDRQNGPQWRLASSRMNAVWRQENRGRKSGNLFGLAQRAGIPCREVRAEIGISLQRGGKIPG